MASEDPKIEEGAAAGQNEESTAKKNPHKHDTGAADLEKVTDFVEEKECSFASANVSDVLMGTPQPKQTVTKITIRKEDVELIMRELEVTKATAEKKLREHRGNAKDAMKSILGF